VKISQKVLGGLLFLTHTVYWLHSRLQSLKKLKNSVWAKYMGGPHGQKSVWATAHTVPAPMDALRPYSRLPLHRCQFLLNLVEWLILHKWVKCNHSVTFCSVTFFVGRPWKTRCPAIAERLCCRVHYSFCQ